jgi:predicted naringenin-chalcone synthase
LFHYYFNIQNPNLAYINYITQAMPAYCHAQNDIGEYMQSAYPIPEADAGKVRAMYSRCGIDKRFSVLPDFDKNKTAILFDKETILMQDRMKVYDDHASHLGAEACKKLPVDTNTCTHLITVSCTGMSAPGLDIQLLKKLQLAKNIVRTSVNFMGCYAFVHALKLADAFCKAEPNAKVLIVLVELCTLHFQQEYSFENVATSMLFADGCSAVWVSNVQQEKSLSIKSFYSEVHGDSEQDMTWNLTDKGFKMTLSAYVPDILADNIQSLLHRAIAKSNLQQSQIKYWAIHPGGKKIVQEIQKALQLQADDVAMSKLILQENGNMSSATLPLVIQKCNENSTANEYMFACAFGPGLTMETVLLETC